MSRASGNLVPSALACAAVPEEKKETRRRAPTTCVARPRRGMDFGPSTTPSQWGFPQPALTFRRRCSPESPPPPRRSLSAQGYVERRVEATSAPSPYTSRPHPVALSAHSTRRFHRHVRDTKKSNAARPKRLDHMCRRCVQIRSRRARSSRKEKALVCSLHTRRFASSSTGKTSERKSSGDFAHLHRITLLARALRNDLVCRECLEPCTCSRSTRPSNLPDSSSARNKKSPHWVVPGFTLYRRLFG